MLRDNISQNESSVLFVQQPLTEEKEGNGYCSSNICRAEDKGVGKGTLSKS